jgi:ferredoxin-NADP reductase/Na+-translocating ferredoxin:NAD+ oxidoreductase RnfD subunit
MLKAIDEFLNKITTYRFTLYYLIFLIGVAVLLSFFSILVYSPLDILINSFAAVIACFIANYIFAKFLKAATNIESVFITALILVLIIPVKFPANLMFLIGASAVAMAAKYLLTVEKRHLFNPAAVSVAAISFLSAEHSATWWVGTPVMLPFVLIGGLLLLRKIQRERQVYYFLIAYLLLTGISAFINMGSFGSILQTWQYGILHSALFFFMFVMLTEPLTSPTTKKLQGYYGIVVAILYSSTQLRLFGIIFTPEIALCIGNVFSYIANPNYRLLTPMLWKKQLSRDTLEFAFSKTPDFKFIPGQYMEWTLPHQNADSRGNRRYFSISSSPTENEIAIVVKFYNPSSSYKKTLFNLQNSNKITAAQVAGDFTLPKDFKTPLVFVAGGVGIAPFRSMIQYIIDKNLSTDIILLYTNRTKEDILFSDIFERAKLQGIKTIYNLTDLSSVPPDWQGTTGYITNDLIKKEIPDYQKRAYYLSGPQLMVQRFEQTLLDAGVRKSKIKTDFFPGYSEM